MTPFCWALQWSHCMLLHLLFILRSALAYWKLVELITSFRFESIPHSPVCKISNWLYATFSPFLFESADNVWNVSDWL